MKPLIILLGYLVLLHSSAAARKKLPYDEININAGILSRYQVLGISEGPLRGYMDMPYRMSFASFISYKKYFNNWCAVSLSMGLDHQNGRLSYGNEHMSTYSPGYSGAYKRRSYTVALGYTLVYRKKGQVSSYGFVSAGYTYAAESYTFVKDLRYQSVFYGPQGAVPTNPYKETHNYVACQVSPIAWRYQGRYAAYVEFGYGYRGIISGGVAFNIKKRDIIVADTATGH